MSATMADTLTKAVIAFGMMAVIAVICAGVIRLIVSVLARSAKAMPKPAVAPRPAAAVSKPSAAALPGGEPSEELAVVIAAACHAAVGAHRIVYLAETPRAASWTAQMRARHHQSHLPHR